MKRALFALLAALTLSPATPVRSQAEPYIPPKIEPEKPLSPETAEPPIAPGETGKPKDPDKPTSPGGDPVAPKAEAPTLGVADSTSGKLPKFTEELAVKAAEAFSRRDWDKARAAYVEILEADPTNALALANIGAVEHQTGNFDKAQTYLEAAVQQNPRLAQSWMVLGLIYYEKEQINLAISALTRALHENPLEPRAHNYLAIVIKSIGWTNGAESELQRAIELKPDYAGAHFNLALMYLEKKPPALELARRHYETARSLGAEADPLVEERLEGK